MFYVIPNTLLKVALNTNKTGHHGVRYNVEHGDQFYWCLMTLSIMCQVTPIKLVTMFYVLPDSLLKASLNTNKTGHHFLRYT
jgi:hypothetical protein